MLCWLRQEDFSFLLSFFENPILFRLQPIMIWPRENLGTCNQWKAFFFLFIERGTMNFELHGKLLVKFSF